MTGSGTVGDPYIITSYADLNNVRNDLTAYYELGSNIECVGQTFIPIGTSAVSFTGSINGKNNTISNLTLHTNYYDCGFIGYLGSGGILKNIKFDIVNITATGPNGSVYVAPVVARATSNTTVENVHVRNLNIDYTWTAANTKLNGLIGVAGGIVTKCSVDTGSIIGDGTQTGNIPIVSGFFYSGTDSVTKSYSSNLTLKSGHLIPGQTWINAFAHNGSSTSFIYCYARNNLDTSIAGHPASVVSNFMYSPSKATTNLYSASTFSEFVGEEAGFVYSQSTYSLNGCYYDYDLAPFPAKISGTGSEAVGETTANMKSLSTFIGWDFDTIWAIDAAQVINDGYPYLIDNPPISTPITVIPPEPDPIRPIEYIGLYKTDGTTQSTNEAIISFPNTTLGQPDYDKRINFIDIDFNGSCTLYLYGNSSLQYSATLSTNNRQEERIFIPLGNRVPVERFQLKISSTDPNFYLYNIELDYSVQRRKYE